MTEPEVGSGSTKDTHLEKILELAEKALLDSYTYMVLQPFDLLQDLLKNEQWHAAAVAVKHLEKATVDFKVQLENARNERMRLIFPEPPAPLEQPAAAPAPETPAKS